MQSSSAMIVPRASKDKLRYHLGLVGRIVQGTLAHYTPRYLTIMGKVWGMLFGV
ncbi:hypothetical protein BDV38DRAFT_252720 [Aspergillus pseudotamarii]|uniref:Uncharacterized protein n=1 Tax=Aspergillus pseudotamarii TaxID=132259 RepID=A0A5N6SNC3_ASPPS|nr:uncharacterized protein BDV38DRAFT_252720 [Aspergillus pseudotamarii]KAE8135407.1 hypothetical protein BDV38DRAFT_252720 [Aspergillus pseudotamarii]